MVEKPSSWNRVKKTLAAGAALLGVLGTSPDNLHAQVPKDAPAGAEDKLFFPQFTSAKEYDDEEDRLNAAIAKSRIRTPPEMFDAIKVRAERERRFGKRPRPLQSPDR